jgi:hypothetical protein
LDGAAVNVIRLPEHVPLDELSIDIVGVTNGITESVMPLEVVGLPFIQVVPEPPMVNTDFTMFPLVGM